jgi:TolB-like protein
VVFAAVAVAMAGLGLWWAIRTPANGAATNGPLSVAVIPFENGSGDPQNDYLANGIAQAVTTRLHRAGLRVIPWETARRFDSTNPMQVARTLHVDAVLTGSVQMNGARMRLTVSLVERTTGFISWTDEFEESFGDIFQVQTRIAQGVATNLGHRLTNEAAARLATTESSSTEAYDFYLQGAEYLQQGTRDSTNVAHKYFTRSVGIDPNLTEAQVGLGAVYLERFWNGWGGGSANLNLAATNFEKALQRDAANMQARRGVILIEWYRGHGNESGIQFARDAAGANNIDTLMARAEAYKDGCSGITERLALPTLNRVLALDPGNQWAWWHVALSLHKRRADENTSR